MPAIAAAVAAGVAVWVVSAAAAYLLSGPVGSLCRAMWERATRRPAGQCPARLEDGGFVYACHLPEGHEVGLVHYDRSADVRWAATPRGSAILGAGLKVQ